MKFVKMFCVVTIIFNCFCYNVMAFNEPVSTCVKLISEGDLIVVPSNNKPSSEFSLAENTAISSVDEFDEIVQTSLKNYSDEIDIESLDMSVDDGLKAYQNLLNNCGELFHVSKSASYFKQDNKITKIIPSYTIQQSEYEQKLKFYNDEIMLIMSYIDENMSDFEKLIIVHDYLCSHFEYDETLQISQPIDMLENKKGVCNAYALLYKQILNKLDIPNTTASSKTMNHIWNVVYLDDHWYHVDVTWDDPIHDRMGMASHKYFLIDDTNMQTDYYEHYDWDCDEIADSDKYVKKYEFSSAPFVYVNDNWYCIDNEQKKLCSINFNTEQKNELFSFSNIYWEANGSGYWDGVFCGLVGMGKDLYFNTPTSVIKFYTGTNNTKVVSQFSCDDNKYLYGLRENKGVLECGFAISPNDYVDEIKSLNVFDDGKINFTYYKFTNASKIVSKHLSSQVNIVANVYNGSNDIVSPIIYSAVYDSKNKLCKVDSYEISDISSLDNKFFIATFNYDDINDKSVKFIALESDSSLVPISSMVNIK